MQKTSIILFTQNSKIRKIKDKRTFNFGIPAYKSKSGFVTCPAAAACIKGCYAKSGAYLFSNVAQAFERRLEATLRDDFVSIALSQLDRQRVERLRIHDSGDFYSKEYLNKWLEIIKARPNIEFYAYTKNRPLFEGLKLPSNFIIIRSFGGKYDKSIDQDRDRHSRVFESLPELLTAGYANASEDDLVALGDNPKVGLVYHGTKNIENTDWRKVKV
jgi:hypothetical protein